MLDHGGHRDDRHFRHRGARLQDLLLRGHAEGGVAARHHLDEVHVRLQKFNRDGFLLVEPALTRKIKS